MGPAPENPGRVSVSLRVGWTHSQRPVTGCLGGLRTLRNRVIPASESLHSLLVGFVHQMHVKQVSADSESAFIYKVSLEYVWKEVSSRLFSQPVPDQRALSSGDWHSLERLPGGPACVDLLEHARWMYCADGLLTARKWPEETGTPSPAVSAVLPPSGSFARLRGWGWEQTKPGQPSEWGGRAHSGHLS